MIMVNGKRRARSSKHAPGLTTAGGPPAFPQLPIASCGVYPGSASFRGRTRSSILPPRQEGEAFEELDVDEINGFPNCGPRINYEGSIITSQSNLFG